MEKWYKIKAGKMTKIKTPINKEAYLNKGYTLSQVKTENNVEKITSFSPLTRSQAWEKHKNKVGLF